MDVRESYFKRLCVSGATDEIAALQEQIRGLTDQLADQQMTLYYSVNHLTERVGRRGAESRADWDLVADGAGQEWAAAGGPLRRVGPYVIQPLNYPYRVSARFVARPGVCCAGAALLRPVGAGHATVNPGGRARSDQDRALSYRIGIALATRVRYLVYCQVSHRHSPIYI